MNKKNYIGINSILYIFLLSTNLFAQSYWNNKTQLIPFRFPILNIKQSKYLDLDNDKDPDIIFSLLNDSIPVMWIDDDDDMKIGDFEGDIDNDCLCIDKNKDGIFGGENDLCIDWTDTNDDGIADIQAIISNGKMSCRNYFDWEADIMYIIDYGENDNVHGFINWNEIMLRAWEHIGHSNFFTDYHGNTLFLKMHASSFRIYNLNCSWENPFIFFDTDSDKLTEMAIRLVDSPYFRAKEIENQIPLFDSINKDYDIVFKKRIDYAAITWDIDNDNGQGNEFDFDMSLKFSGYGFNYSDQVHKFKNMRGLQAADSFIFDSRWRQINDLIFPDQKVSYSKIFNEGKWDYCWFVFDEDDDCNRWERVEFYEPKNLWKIGMEKGGIDNNKQADAIGDRGEFDLDNSGSGRLYISPVDGKIHLFGAEYGIWRIDMNASSFQGYGGLYPPAKEHVRSQKETDKWATIKYTDTDGNGFLDKIEYDLNGDTIFEEAVFLKDLGINDSGMIINTAKVNYEFVTETFKNITENLWNQAEVIIEIAKKMNINTNWYSFMKQPRTLFEKYQYGFWLSFYIFKDMIYLADLKDNQKLKKELYRAYYSGNWTKLKLQFDKIKK